MSIDVPDGFDVKYEDISGPGYIKLSGKIKARAIHRARQTPDGLRPHISEDEAGRARTLAHNVFIEALEYLTKYPADRNSDGVLQRAAQLLEDIYIDEPPEFPDRNQELHIAALTYYLAGYYARAFVLMRGIKEESSADLMRLMFLRELSKLRNTALEALRHKKCADSVLAASYLRGDIDQIQAIEAVLTGTYNKIYILLYEYARSGIKEHLDLALNYSYVGRQLAIDRHLKEWWFTFHCTLALLREYQQNSLWKCLKSMLENDSMKLVRKYIRDAFFRKRWPVIDLWRSQSHVVENINDGKSYCLKMPTSSGKTRIAELAILKFLLDSQITPDKKCIYIAPYRALAVEIEQNLKRSFERIGIRVSQLYGSYDLNPAETEFAKDSRILIATPEKMDAFLRYNAEVAQQIGLVIVDEGHIIDDGERGLGYEMFLLRIIRRYERNGVRMLFISAVMPNVEQFAQWITGRDSKNGVLESDWRASQQLLGVLLWNGESGRVDFMYRDRERIDQSSFIHNYFLKIDPEELRFAHCGHRVFPGSNATKGDLIALAAVNATNEGATLVFVPTKPSLESTAKRIIEVVQIKKKINEHFHRTESVLPVNIDTEEKASKLARCIRYAEEATGSDSIIVKALRNGFVVHYGDVPRNLRIHLEELVREGILQLVVATNTLAQGVNLPVKTILIHSLQQNRGRELSNRDFWNLCGRAGRAMYETQGYVYLLAKSQDEYLSARNAIDGYVEKADTEEIISSIRRLLESIVCAWKENFSDFNSLDIANLCEKLTDDDKRWLESDARVWLDERSRARLRTLDAQLLALIEEQQVDITDIDVDLIQEITSLFKDSLFYAQINSDAGSLISDKQAVSIIVQRIRHISRVCRTKQRQHCYYSMALSLEGCSLVERSKAKLAEYLQRADEYMNQSPEDRASYIVKLCTGFIMQIDDVRPSELPECWTQVLEQWLIGKNAADIVAALDLPPDYNDAMKISTLIDNLCEFRLPWGLNGVSMFWEKSDTLKEDEDETSFTPPDIVSYFASMLRFGVHDPVATVALALGIDNRQAALILSEHYDGSVEASEILTWFKSLEPEAASDFTDDTVVKKILQDFIESVRRRDEIDIQSLRPSRFVPKGLEIPSYIDEATLNIGTELLTYCETNQLHLYSPSVDYIGSVTASDDRLIKRSQDGEVTVTIQKKYQEQGKVYLDISIR